MNIEGNEVNNGLPRRRWVFYDAIQSRSQIPPRHDESRRSDDIRQSRGMRLRRHFYREHRSSVTPRYLQISKKTFRLFPVNICVRVGDNLAQRPSRKGFSLKARERTPNRRRFRTPSKRSGQRPGSGSASNSTRMTASRRRNTIERPLGAAVSL